MQEGSREVTDGSGSTDACGSWHPALGVDYGDARIGVAATDPLGILAHPVETIDQHAGDALSRLAELVSERRVRTVVVGLPLRMNGSEGDSARKVREFVRRLEPLLGGVPVQMQDETLSTAAAAEKLRQAGRSARQQKDVIDQAAAVEILRAWMESLPGADSGLTWSPEPEFDVPAHRRHSRRRR